MLQPFEIFKPLYLEKLLKMKRYFLVTQTYKRNIDLVNDEEKVDLLITDYEEYTLAKTHWDALKTDRFRAVIDLRKPEHKQKLMEMLGQESGYRLFWGVVKSVKELESRINAKYPDNMRRYLQQHTNWRIDREGAIRPVLQMIFGELFINLKYGSQVLRVKFEEIENA